MGRVSLTTAGESHGPFEICVLEGIPAGLSLSAQDIDSQLERRQRGYGRGGRMTIESDRCELAAGVRLGETMGSPIGILVRNDDHKNWTSTMGAAAPEDGSTSVPGSAVPRPGHADFAGMLKSGHTEIRPVLERASARETVARVAGGAVCKRLLEELKVSVSGRVVRIGDIESGTSGHDYTSGGSVDWEKVERSMVGCEDSEASAAMCEAIDAARDRGESLGGVFEVWAWGICPGLGDNTVLDGRIDGRLLGAVGSIPGIKGVELGQAFASAGLPGSEVHDGFLLRRGPRGDVVTRSTNRAGGVEGGMTNGMPVILRAAMKPIPTLTKPLKSVDLRTLKESPAHVERSDITAVPAARVVGEAMVALVLADAYLEKFGGDSMSELSERVSAYHADLEERGLWVRS